MHAFTFKYNLQRSIYLTTVFKYLGCNRVSWQNSCWKCEHNIINKSNKWKQGGRKDESVLATHSATALRRHDASLSACCTCVLWLLGPTCWLWFGPLERDLETGGKADWTGRLRLQRKKSSRWSSRERKGFHVAPASYLLCSQDIWPWRTAEISCC